jgi:hypothetical protein
MEYFISGCKYFLVQTILEIAFIVGLMYLGFSYSGLEVGNEYFYEVIIGVLGYHGFFKLLIYLVPFLLLFVVTCYLGKFKSPRHFSRVNAVLSLAIPFVVTFLKQLSFKEMSTVLIATAISALIILLYSQYKTIKKTNSSVTNWN